MTKKLVKLGQVCKQDRQSIKTGERSDLPYLGLECIESGTGQLLTGEMSKTPESPRANSFAYDDRHVLYGKLRPYLNKVALPNSAGKCSTEIIPLLPTEALDRRYLAFFLRASSTVNKISDRVSGARMPRADMDMVLALDLYLPSLDEQRRTVNLLTRAQGILIMRREAALKAADLVPAIFTDMFGDPATNPRSWSIVPLGAVASVQGGLQVTHARSSFELERPYLRVANVYRSRLDLTEVKSIRLTEGELRRTRLEAGDLLFVEGHGNAQEVGRVAVWDASIDECTHQNHLIRARTFTGRLLPSYACVLLNTPGGRQSLLRAGKTTSGLSTISAQNVKDAAVMLPPIAEQERFAKFESEASAMAALQRDALQKAQEVFTALLDRVFSDVSETVSIPE